MQMKGPPSSNALPRECPLPPPLMSEYVRLIYPHSKTALHVVAVGERVHGFLTHWWDGRAVPCKGPGEECWYCQQRQQPRWNGYLNVIALPSLRRRILCITEGAYRHSKTLRDHDGTLRGKGLKLERMGTAKNAPVRVQVGTPASQVTLPSDWDLTATLCRIWGILPTFFNNRIPDPEPAPANGEGKRQRKARKGGTSDD